MTDGGDGGVPDLLPDAAPPLGCPLGCLPPAAAGWTGPSAVYDGANETKPAGCPTQYTLKEVDAHRGMTVGTTTCDCGSGTNSGAKCTANVENHALSDCSDTVVATKVDVPSATCTNKTGAYIKVNGATLARGSCTHAQAKVSGPAPALATADIACGLPQNAVCSQRADCVATPLPDAPFTRLCIHKSGVESCPSLDYAVRFVGYKSTTDERACTCSGNPAGGACGTALAFAKSTNCPLGGVAGDFTTCSVAGSVAIGGLAPSGITCAAGTPASTGTVKDAEPVTFCCNK